MPNINSGHVPAPSAGRRLIFIENYDNLKGPVQPQALLTVKILDVVAGL
jgi:hypothetical protein